MKISHMPRRHLKAESGQGLVEYALILILLIIFVLCLILFIIPNVLGWINGNGANTQQPTIAPTSRGEPALDIAELGTNTEIVDSENIPLFNCNNPNQYGIDVQRSRRIEHKVTIDGQGQIEGSILQVVRVGVQGRYGIEDGQTEERSYTIHLTASPNSWIEYKIEWRYVWREGKITFKSPTKTDQTYSYRVRAGLEFRIANIEQKSCKP